MHQAANFSNVLSDNYQKLIIINNTESFSKKGILILFGITDSNNKLQAIMIPILESESPQILSIIFEWIDACFAQWFFDYLLKFQVICELEPI